MFESRRIKRMNREGLSRQPRNKAFYGNETARWARDAPKKSSSAWLHHRKWKKSATKIYVSPHEGKEVEKRMCVCKFYTRSRKSEPWYVCNVRTRLSDVSNLCALLCTGEIKIFMECTFECCFCAVGFFFFFWFVLNVLLSIVLARRYYLGIGRGRDWSSRASFGCWYWGYFDSMKMRTF